MRVVVVVMVIGGLEDIQIKAIVSKVEGGGAGGFGLWQRLFGAVFAYFKPFKPKNLTSQKISG